MSTIQGSSGNNSYRNDVLQSIDDSNILGVAGGVNSGISGSQLDRAAAVAEEGFAQTLAARRITNAYAAAKEVR